MRPWLIAVALAAGALLLTERVDAQYRYTDDNGVTRVTQYKLHVPERHRDAAVWIGPRGVGHPALSEEQRQMKQRDEAYRRIGVANERLVPLRKPADQSRWWGR